MKFQIKEARVQAGLSQKELAKLIGVAPSTFNGYESGNHDPKSDLLIKIAKACNVTVDFLLGYDGEVATKKSPSTAEAAPGEDVAQIFDYLNDGLVNLGLIRDGEDITDQQAEVLLGICSILRATFEDK